MNAARKERKRVEIYLVNGIRLMGCIESFDQYLVMLRTPIGLQGIYKRAISTIQLDMGTRPGPRGPRPGGHGERHGPRDGSGSFREPREPREPHETHSTPFHSERASDGPVVVTRRRRPFSTGPHHSEPGSGAPHNSEPGNSGNNNE